MRYQKAIKILNVKFGFLTNNKSLLPELPAKPEYESLLTDFHKIEEIPYGNGLDSVLVIIDQPDRKPSLRTVEGMTIASGAFSKLTKQTKDLRYSLFGNEGLIFRQTLKLLEDKYSIFSFHGCVMQDPSSGKMYLICGGAGSGKSCFVLKGIEMGMKLFSVEMAHFKVTNDGVEFYKGALVDNIRIGNLRYNYPFILDRLNLKLGNVKNEWGKKIALDLSPFQTRPNKFVNPELVVILPRVEQGRKEYFSQQESDNRKVSRMLFENASEKIGQSVLLYETVPFVCLDSPQAARKRIDAINSLLAYKNLQQVVSMISGPEDCWKCTSE